MTETLLLSLQNECLYSRKTCTMLNEVTLLFLYKYDAQCLVSAFPSSFVHACGIHDREIITSIIVVGEGRTFKVTKFKMVTKNQTFCWSFTTEPITARRIPFFVMPNLCVDVAFIIIINHNDKEVICLPSIVAIDKRSTDMTRFLALGNGLLLLAFVAPVTVVQAFQLIQVVSTTRTTGTFFASTSSSSVSGNKFDRSSATALALKKANGASSGGSSSSKDGQRRPELKRVSPDVEGIPIPFIDHTGKSFIECYADSVAHVNGVEYTIGVPCDYSVALCYFDTERDNELVPIELDDALMDDIFPIAASIVADEFDEELVLQRTPQTLTLVGELEDDDDDEEEDDEDDDEEDDEDDEEEVEVLLTFEHREKEYHLVRLLDPILLVGKVDKKSSSDKASSSLEASPASENRILLTPEESNDIMPLLENMFLEFHDDPDNLFA
jgi:hypothetical protein